MRIRSTKWGSIFFSGCEALVNPVNCMGNMGSGLARQFKKKFPENYTMYADACSRGVVRPGRILVFPTLTMKKPHYIFNFPTKDNWRDKSDIRYIQNGMEDLITQVKTHKIRTIAIPALGCGLGGLDWGLVEPVIRRELERFNNYPGYDVDIQLYEPHEPNEDLM